MIAVNMSGEEGVATQTTDMCVNGYTLASSRLEALTSRFSLVSDTQEMAEETLSTGMTIRMSADGQSFAGDVRNLEDLREMLASMLPEGTSTRSVRLVN